MNTKSNLLHGSFEEWAKQAPDKKALVFQDQEVSYAKLNMRADYLASTLLQLGLKNEDFCLLMVDKSVEMIVSLFGILKAGGAYIPVDPEIPQKRLELIIKKSTPKIIVTESKYKDHFKTIADKTTILFIDAVEFPDSYQKDFSVDISNRQLCYVIFTSGTTGQPKGVMIEHRGIINTISGLIKHYYIFEESRLLQFSSLAFDSSVAEIFAVLSAGGTLILASNSDLKNITKLSSLLKEQQVTVVTLPPALLNHMDFTGNDTLQTLISAGEECSVKLANRLYKQVPHFINAYGPTECSVCVSTYEITSDLTTTVPIGTPISGVTVFLLDEKMRQVPVGEKGELYVGGKGIARGYLRDKARSTARFIQSPFNKEDILYKTNDRAIQSDDGNYQFLGRSDLQVKIRGNRIELEEVEKIINGFERIYQAALGIHKNSRDESVIICYYTSESPIESNVLRLYVKTYLPDYMVPHQFVYLERMPLNTSGKIDRNALGNLEVGAVEKLDMDLPTTETEKRMASIWKKVLHVNSVGMSDDFFDLDGDSLLAMQLISEVNTTFDTDVDIAQVFEHSTFTHFVDHVKNTTDQKAL